MSVPDMDANGNQPAAWLLFGLFPGDFQVKPPRGLRGPRIGRPLDTSGARAPLLGRERPRGVVIAQPATSTLLVTGTGTQRIDLVAPHPQRVAPIEEHAGAITRRLLPRQLVTM